MVHFILSFVQLQVIYLLNLQYTPPLTRSPSAIAEPLVYFKCVTSCNMFGNIITEISNYYLR